MGVVVIFKNKRIVSKIAMFISVFTSLLPNNFAGAAKRHNVKKLSSNNFVYKKRGRRLPFKQIGISDKKSKNLPVKIVKLKNNTYKVQNQNSGRIKFLKTSKKLLDNHETLTNNFPKKQSQNSNPKKIIRSSKEFANEHKMLNDISLKQNQRFNSKEAIQVTKKFVGEHKVLTGTTGVTTGLFVANRIYNLKKYHKKLPFATAQICNSSPFQMHFLNVGEGDCILVRYNDGNQFHNWLVDVGYNLGFGLTDVTRYLTKLGVENLDGIILTHPHPDHYWNLKYVLNDNVKKFYHSYMDAPVKLIDKINSLSYEERVTKPINNFGGEKINVAEQLKIQNQQPYTVYEHKNFSIKALGPLKEHKDVNDNSIVLLITYGEKKMLLMGDAGIEAEKELMDKYGEMIKDVDMVKIGHHGNNSSSSKEFVKCVNPKIAVCSTGGQFVTAGFLNLHEQPWIMNRWKACCNGKCEILTTEEQNNIVLYCENSNDTIKSARLGRNAKNLVQNA